MPTPSLKAPHVPQPTAPWRERYTVPARSALNVLAAASPQVSPVDLAHAGGLDLDVLHDQRARIPLRHLVALYETAAYVTGDSALGLHVGARADFRAFDVLGYVAANSATLGASLANAVRYLPLWTDGAALEIAADGRTVGLSWEYVDPTIGECRQDCEMTLRTFSELVRLLVPGVTPREIHFRHTAPEDSTEHTRSFRSSVRFRMPTNQIVFDRGALARPVPNADAALFAVLSRYADALLLEAPAGYLLLDRVQLLIQQSLPEGNARLGTVARRMGMSPRSLERHLTARGHSFRALLGSVRCGLAEQYLRDPEIAIGDIAHRLGYADAREFHRAFRSWTRTTPRRYRMRTSREIN